MENDVEKSRKYEVDPENEKSKIQPLAILYLYKILYELTDENYGLTANQIIDQLKNYGIILKRQAVVRYIKLLRDTFGADITSGQGRRDGYHLDSRTFELADVKMLADAVASARFIEEGTAKELMKNLGKLVSQKQQSELKRNVFVEGRVKTQNKVVTTVIDTIHHAIASNKKISFDYFDYDVNKVLKQRGETRVCTPYALLWSDDRYYLVASHPKYTLAHFRVDRMRSVKILEKEKAEPIPKEFLKHDSFDVPKYLKTTFSMFSGADGEVTLRFENSLVSVVLDKFGYDTRIIKDGDEHFKINAGVKIEHPEAFFGWMFQFGTRAQILAPANIKQKYSEMLQSVLDNNKSSD